MASKVSLYLPGDDSLLEAASAAYSKISVAAEITGAYKFGTAKEAAKLACAAASKGERAVIIADDGVFNTVKLLLMKVLLTKVSHSDEISEKLGGAFPQDSKEFKIHTSKPQGGYVIPSPDGKFSTVGFKVHKGSVILMSLDPERLDGAISAGALDGAPDSKALLRNRLNAIADSGKTVALADFGLAQAVTGIAAGVGAKEDLFVKSQAECNASPDDPEYIALMAKDALTNAQTDFGIAISEPAQDGSVSICVADSDGAKVEVIHALEGEERSKTAKAATLKLIDTLGECIGTGINPPAPEKKKANIKPLIIVISALVAAAVICLTIGLVIYKTSIGKADVAAESTTMSEKTSSTITETQEDQSADSEIYDEVVPDFGEDDEMSSLLEVIDTTYSGGGIKTQAANGQFTTNGAGTVETVSGKSSNAAKVATTLGAVISSILQDDEPVTDENGETVTASTAPAEPESTTAPAQQGKFVFTVYGYGHGVGLSQRGAIAYAQKGWTCNQILTHYYQGTTLMVDKNTPAEVTRRGVRMTLVAFLCRTVEPEIGPNSPTEALKAQAIAAYTFGMSNGWDRNQSFDPYFNYKGTKVEQAVFSVLHINSEEEQPHAIFVSYNGKYANTVYCASMAGKTTSCRSVWNMAIPYLGGGVTSPETVDISTVEYTVDQMRSIVAAYSGNSEILNQDPSTWIRIISHDGSYSNAIGYVDRISVGGKECSGSYFRTNVLGYGLRSHCFTIKYVKYQ